MKKHAPNNIIFDIGSNKIAALAANISKIGEAKVIAQILQRSNGFKSGWISNLELAENSVIAAIYALEKECDKSINKVTISLSGEVKSYYVSYTIKINNQIVTKQDVRKLMQKTLAEFAIANQEIIHYFPIEFCLDNNNIVDNPIGMYAKEITCQMHIIAANALMLRNLTNCFAKCHIEVTDIVLSIYANGLSSLQEDEKNTGAIIIDFGDHITSFAVFLNNKIMYVGSVPIGSHQITLDIAKNLSISLSSAEKLKILYGDVRPDLFSKNESIRVSDFELENEYDDDLTISNSELAQIIKPRAEEILIQLKKKYDQLNMDNLIAKRVVISGGGAGLGGIKNLVAAIFQKQVKFAKPEIVDGFEQDANLLVYSTALGIIKSKTLKYQKNSFKPSAYEDAGWLKKTFLWFKENI